MFRETLNKVSASPTPRTGSPRDTHPNLTDVSEQIRTVTRRILPHSHRPNGAGGISGGDVFGSHRDLVLGGISSLITFPRGTAVLSRVTEVSIFSHISGVIQTGCSANLVN